MEKHYYTLNYTHNEVPVKRSISQKHLRLHLDQRLDFSKHINEKISKAQKRNISQKNFVIFYQEKRF